MTSMSRGEARPYPGWVEALSGRGGLWGAMAWGFAEGTLFFIVPDVLFTLTTVLRPRRGLLQLAAAVLGATLAGGLMYAWSARDPVQARSVVARVPHVGERMIAATERRWQERGVQNLLRPAVRALATAGVTPNQVTVTALVLSAATGALIAFFPTERWPLILLGPWLLVRMALNAIDGMLAREHGQKSPLGAILNELRRNAWFSSSEPAAENRGSPSTASRTLQTDPLCLIASSCSTAASPSASAAPKSRSVRTGSTLETTARA